MQHNCTAVDNLLVEWLGLLNGLEWWLGAAALSVFGKLTVEGQMIDRHSAGCAT